VVAFALDDHLVEVVFDSRPPQERAGAGNEKRAEEPDCLPAGRRELSS
jgi:hypothetical protein